jgi:hypothetical protein
MLTQLTVFATNVEILLKPVNVNLSPVCNVKMECLADICAVANPVIANTAMNPSNNVIAAKIGMTMNKESIASSKTLQDLFSGCITLNIPEYQRAYSWEQEQVQNLLEDLLEAQNKQYEEPYLVGSIIVEKTDIATTDWNVVDGQQRLTTLLIVLHALNDQGESALQTKLKVANPLSHKQILVNLGIIKNWIAHKVKYSARFESFILEKITFVLIQAPSLDDAFTFFDSQNSRGKRLENKDLLKAHHLRYVADELVGLSCTKIWEKLDRADHGNVSLQYLLEDILGRPRKWGRRDYSELNIKKEFQAQRTKKKQNRYYKLNNYQQPPIFSEWKYSEGKNMEDGLELIYQEIDAWYGTRRLNFLNNSMKHLPFQITQKLEGGEQFFWFVEKYELIYQELFGNHGAEDTPTVLPAKIRELLQIYDDLSYNTGMRYLKNGLEAALVLYYDKFRKEEIEDFAFYAEHILGRLRLHQHSVSYASFRNYIRDRFNLFAYILDASFPEHIIDEAKRFLVVEKKLLNEYSGIRDTYFKKVREYHYNHCTILKSEFPQTDSNNQS